MMTWITLTLLAFLLGPAVVFLTGGARLRGDWRVASHEPTGQAPDAAEVREAVVQAYAARAFAWRGAFGVHTWIAVKPANSDTYTRYEAIGWRLYRGLPLVSVASERAPDAQWFGAHPTLLRELRGAAAEAVIAALPQAVASYPKPIKPLPDLFMDRRAGPGLEGYDAWLDRHERAREQTRGRAMTYAQPSAARF
jgi:hypothetical protein